MKLVTEKSTQPSLSSLEADRKRFYNRARFYFLLIFSGTFVLLNIRAKNTDSEYAVRVIGLAVLLGSWVYISIAEKYARNFRMRSFKAAIEALWPGALYQPMKGIKQKEFERARIFLYEINRYSSVKLIKTQVEKTKFKLALVYAAYNPYGAKESAKIFDGIFLIADFNKNTKGRTYVLPDKAERLLGHTGQELQSLAKSHGELVRTEDIEFEKYFVVYSTDQAEARYILSPSFMRNLLELRETVHNNVFISFIDGAMYLGISEATYDRRVRLATPLTSDTSTVLSESLLAINRLISRSLTTRIWSKT